MRYHCCETEASIAKFCKCTDRNLASSAELAQQCSLAPGSGAGRCVIQESKTFVGWRIPGANLDGQRPLSGGWAHYCWRDNLRHEFHFSQTIQPGCGENDSVVLVRFELPETRIHVPAERLDIEIGTNGLQLSQAAQTAGSNPCLLRQLLDEIVADRAERVARIFAYGNCCDCEFGRKFGGKIFQAVDSQVNLIFGERFLNLLGKHALGADFCERDVNNLIACSLYDLNLNLVAALAQQFGNVIGLPQSELRSSSPNAQARH